uniref:Major facilitator superfamily (MFS) profile domain-containing protein n=1 Tax=Setaria digitata TaxID=48799 RepID=A0A915PKZ2_9BILA
MAEKDVENGKVVQKSMEADSADFKISDIQICGNYMYYLTLVYFFMVLSQFEVPVEYVKLGTTVQNIGLMIGAIVAGNLADVYGRKKEYSIFCSVSNPYFMENLPDKHRMWVATVVTYSPNYIILSGIAYLCQRWKILSWTAAAITVLPLIMIPFLMDTPRWLIKKGRGDEASKAAVYIRKWDVEVTPEKEKQITATVQEAAEEELAKMGKGKKNYYFYHLFSNWELGSYAIVFATSLFSTSFISYGIAYNMDALAGTVYVNVIILGAARWAINILAAGLEVSIKSVGRRLLHLFAVGFIAINMGTIFVIYLLTWPKIDTYKAIVKGGGRGDAIVHAIITFTRYSTLLAAAMCTELFVLDAVQPTELFPTPIRSAGIAFIQTFNRLGTIVSPLVFIPSKHWPPAPFLLMFLTSATDFLLYFFLVPETRGRELPDNMPGERADTSEENAKVKGQGPTLLQKNTEKQEKAENYDDDAGGDKKEEKEDSKKRVREQREDGKEEKSVEKNRSHVRGTFKELHHQDSLIKRTEES